MKTNWNLDVIYKGLDDPKYKADFEAFKRKQLEFKEYVENSENEEKGKRVRTIIFMEEEITKLQELKWWDWSVDELKKHGGKFSSIEKLLGEITE